MRSGLVVPVVLLVAAVGSGLWIHRLRTIVDAAADAPCPHCKSGDVDRGRTGLDMCNRCGGLSRAGRPLRPGGESGSATLEFMLMLGFMVFPVCGLMAVAAWPQRLNAADAAAYEAAKAAVEASDPAAGADLGRERALEVLANHGFDTDDVTVSYSSASPARSDALVAHVTITLPAIQFPGVGGWDAIQVTRSSTQRVGDYRGFE